MACRFLTRRLFADDGKERMVPKHRGPSGCIVCCRLRFTLSKPMSVDGIPRRIDLPSIRGGPWAELIQRLKFADLSQTDSRKRHDGIAPCSAFVRHTAPTPLNTIPSIFQNPIGPASSQEAVRLLRRGMRQRIG